MKLTELQYSTNRSGLLLLYRLTPGGFHHGGLFLARQVQYPEEEVAMTEGKRLADEHLARGLEVRITNGGDQLVFHAKGSKVIFPPEGAEAFWKNVGGLDA